MGSVLRLGRLGVALTAVVLVLTGAGYAAPRSASDCIVGSTCGVADLALTGTVSSVQPQVGDTLTWSLTVTDANAMPAYNVLVDVTLPANVQLVSTYADRGTGCTTTSATTLHCSLDWLADTAQIGHVVITGKVTATGDHTLTAVTSYSSPSGPVGDPNPSNNTVSVASSTPTPPPPPVLPVIAAGIASPAVKAGKRTTVTFAVTRSDNAAAMTDGTLTSTATLSKKAIAHTQGFVNGVASVTVTIPKKSKGKVLKVTVSILSTTNGTAAKSATFTVH